MTITTLKAKCSQSSLEKWVFAALELIVFFGAVVVLGWYVQSKEPVVDFEDVPGYRIIEVSETYIEIKWVKAALITDCPGRVEPAIVGEYASHAIPSYPFIIQKERKTFTRRYEIPHYFPYGDYQLRVAMVSQCNPLFEGRQIVAIDFQYGPFVN